MADSLPRKMLVSKIWQILILCIFQVFVAESSECSVKCLCGEQPNSEIVFSIVQNANEDCTMEFLSAVCASHNCLYSPDDDASENVLVEENRVSAKEKYLSPIRFSIPPLDEEAEESPSKLRLRRFPQSCNDSISPIRHAVIDCSVWPEFITCDINCTHGYAMMEDGKSVLQTTRKCRESESTWQPKASFPVCEPYINCKAILVKPGDLYCKSSGEMFSYCDISCEVDENKNEVPQKRYECLDENFEKSLPHCATVDKDENLIPRPQASQSLPRAPQKSTQGPKKTSQRTQTAKRRP